MTREDAVKGLRNVADWHYGKYEQTHEEDYLNDGDFLTAVANMLKEQAPRIMTLEEVKQWCEIHPHKQDPIWVEFQHGYGTDGWRVGLINSGLIAWCKDNEARCWTSRPDEKRRVETPWE